MMRDCRLPTADCRLPTATTPTHTNTPTQPPSAPVCLQEPNKIEKNRQLLPSPYLNFLQIFLRYFFVLIYEIK
jgi:hypothetical protein